MTDPSTSRRMPPAPDGFATWLDYAVANMDTRTPYHDMLWECGTAGEIEFDRDDMYAAVLSELDSLRQGDRAVSCRRHIRRERLSAALVPQGVGSPDSDRQRPGAASLDLRSRL